MTGESRLSPTSAGGWRIGEPRPAFDQHPDEVAALADARAHQATGDLRWQAGVRHAIAWFNRDQGAESTLARRRAPRPPRATLHKGQVNR
ncbi:hypothetical protein AB0E59_28020 [Lentzea sp. NPDC034063]|uniref:hypothetical protein n=1 Tax=unclassified Lentzea TaxID=2643253 RepID=UPI0033D1B458